MPSMMSEELNALNECIDAIERAEAVLARTAKRYPDVGICIVRAIIDVERGNLRNSRQHVLSAKAALPPPPSEETPDER
jgi:hypothetical protein